MKKQKKIVKTVLVAVTILGVLFLGGCGIQGLISKISELKGSLIGNNYEIVLYDNYGARFLTVNGDKIDIEGNTTIDGNGEEQLSSVITITVDGKEIESCGDTVVFEGKGLKPVVDFSLNETIDSKGDGLTSLTSVGRTLNKYKNYFGKSRVVLIQSQLGVPVCAYEGDDVYWEIPDDLPKMTKLMIDGKPLYIHRANFQIIDTELLEEK